MQTHKKVAGDYRYQFAGELALGPFATGLFPSSSFLFSSLSKLSKHPLSLVAFICSVQMEGLFRLVPQAGHKALSRHSVQIACLCVWYITSGISIS